MLELFKIIGLNASIFCVSSYCKNKFVKACLNGINNIQDIFDLFTGFLSP